MVDEEALGASALGEECIIPYFSVPSRFGTSANALLLLKNLFGFSFTVFFFFFLELLPLNKLVSSA